MSFIRYPAYYKEFRCSAGKCTDSCCMHWEIDIDEDTLSYYDTIEGELGEKLEENIERDREGAHFILDEDERCPFLQKDGLCELICKLGEDSICQICSDHPRFYDWYEDGVEQGVGLACEEAAKLILDPNISDEIITQIIPEETKHPKTDKSDNDVFAGEDSLDEKLTEEERAFINLLLDARADQLEAMNAIIQLPFYFFEESYIDRLIGLFLSLEINSEAWPLSLLELKANLPAVIEHIPDFFRAYPPVSEQMDRLYHYFIYRHFMKARNMEAEDFDIEEYNPAFRWQNFAMLSIAMIFLMDVNKHLQSGTFTFKDQINICKLYSQEIEYSEENTEILADMAMT